MSGSRTVAAIREFREEGAVNTRKEKALHYQ